MCEDGFLTAAGLAFRVCMWRVLSRRLQESEENIEALCESRGHPAEKALESQKGMGTIFTFTVSNRKTEGGTWVPLL